MSVRLGQKPRLTTRPSIIPDLCMRFPPPKDSFDRMVALIEAYFSAFDQVDSSLSRLQRAVKIRSQDLTNQALEKHNAAREKFDAEQAVFTRSKENFIKLYGPDLYQKALSRAGIAPVSF